MNEYISKQSVIDYLNGYLDSIVERGADSLFDTTLFDKGQRQALVKSIQDIDNMPTVEVKHDKGWTSVKDRMPAPETWALVYIAYPSPVFEVERGIQKMINIKKLFYDGISFYCDFGAITHWMPLPEPPENEDKDSDSKCREKVRYKKCKE